MIAEINKDVERRMAQVKVQYNKMIEAKEQCLESAYEHISGMFCYACDPNWEQWLTKNAEGKYSMKVNNKVCKKLSEKCYSYLESIEESSVASVEMFKLNKFLDQDYLIKKAVAENDYVTLRSLYNKANSISQPEWANIMTTKKIFQIPEDCTSKDCPYICKSFITPSGVNAHELFAANSMKYHDKVKSKTHHLRNVKSLTKKIVEQLGIDFVDSAESIMPIKNASIIDTSSKVLKERKVEITQEELELLQTKIDKDIYRTFEENDHDEAHSENEPTTELKEILKMANEKLSNLDSKVLTKTVETSLFGTSSTSATTFGVSFTLIGALLMYLSGLFMIE